ncbi:MAG: cytochrome c [Alphaproteobacteria bacterium]|nr:MAG: cytochrome c [Alphaproteobacteria bacterium]
MFRLCSHLSPPESTPGSRFFGWTGRPPPLPSAPRQHKTEDSTLRKTGFAIAMLCALATTGAALAFAMNPDVRKRQETMGLIGANMKRLVEMAKGKSAFDAEEARALAGKISAKAALVPGVFEKPAHDPESKASDEIWTNWDDFAARAAALKAAADAAGGIDSPESLGAAVGQLAGACKACHTRYKR